MDPEEVQMDPVSHEEPGLTRAATAALRVGVPLPAFPPRGSPSAGADTRAALRAASLPAATFNNARQRAER